MKKLISLLLVATILLSLLVSFASAGGEEGTLRELVSYNFETQEQDEAWRKVDLDGKNNGWVRREGSAIAVDGSHFFASFSFINQADASSFGGNYGVQNPNNCLVSPSVSLPQSDDITLVYHIFALDKTYAAETYKVVIYYDNCEFELMRETLTSANSYANPKEVELDLTAYAGKNIEIGFVHCDSTDQYGIGLDCMSISYIDKANVEIESMGITVQTPTEGAQILNQALTTSEGYYVADVFWDPMDSIFAAGKSYCVTATLEAKEGYYFPHRDSTRPTVNGEEAQLLSHSSDQIKISHVFDTVLPNFIDVGYGYSAIQIMLHENLTLEATYSLPEGASNVKHQWYVADTPTAWGTAIEGATEKTFAVPNDEECVKYYRCHITCEVNGTALSTPTEEFYTVMVEVKGSGMPSMFFEDVNLNHWFYHDVEYVYYNRLMNGTSSTHFSPNRTTSRGMIVTILYRMEGSPAVTSPCPFTDVRAGSYYEAPIIWAAENGIVNGLGNGLFAPDKDITREQFAAIFYRFAQYKGWYDEDDCVMTGGFSDLDKVAPWADDAMSWAIGVGLFNGVNKDDGLYLMPQGNATRCQAAAIIHRFLEYFTK